MPEGVELQLGFMSNNDIATWAQISSSYFIKNRKTWCQKQLTRYAEYELKKGGVEILKIIKPVYNTTLKSKVENNFDTCYGNGKNKVDRCKNVSEKIRKKLNDPDINNNTLYQYVCSIKREWYGVPKNRDGIKGHCKFILCKIVDG